MTNQGGWQPPYGQRPGWQQQGGWVPQQQAGWPQSSPWPQQAPRAGGGWPQQPGSHAQGGYPPPGQQQTGPWGPSGGSYLPPPAPRKKSRVGVVLVGLIGAVVLLGAAVAVMGQDGRGGSAGRPVEYQNESYQPPPADLNPPALPVPDTVAEAKQILTANKLYEQSVPQPIRCDVPAINLMTSDNASLKKHMEDVVGCLMTTWIIPVEKAGYQMPRPSVTVYETPITTKCGKLPLPNAVYCGADQQVYYSKNLPTVVPASLRNSRFVVESVVAHEFGHAIQARTAILISSLYFEKNASSKAAENELSRRTELQADCFDGMFLRAVSQSTGMSQQELDTVMALFEAIGDDTLSGKPGIDGNHGLASSRRYWGQMGLASTQISACNTYIAEPATVR